MVHERLDPGVGLRTGIALADAGIEMTWARLQRKYPEAGREEIDALVQAWLLDQPPGPGPSEGFRVRPR